MLSSTALLPLSPATKPAHSAFATASSAAAGRRAVVVRVLRDYGSIPKREPFSSTHSILNEFFKQEKPLVQRTKDQITGNLTIPMEEVSGIRFFSFYLSNRTQEWNQLIPFFDSNRTQEWNRPIPLEWSHDISFLLVLKPNTPLGFQIIARPLKVMNAEAVGMLTLNSINLSKSYPKRKSQGW